MKSWSRRRPDDKKGRSRKEDAADWECQMKGQLPLHHFALINYGEEKSGLDKSSFVLFTRMSSIPYLAL